MPQCEMFCPLCRSKLELKQINFNLAVFICVDMKCPYPANDRCIEVQRKLEDMHKPLEEIMKDRPGLQPPSVASSDSGYSNDSFFNELDSLVEWGLCEDNNDKAGANTSNAQLNNSLLNQLNHVPDLDQFIDDLFK